MRDPRSTAYAGRVSDSGEGRWTIEAAIDEARPGAGAERRALRALRSRGEADFADKVLSAMRHQFGGHLEKAPTRRHLRTKSR